jgi:hypothetical protein
MCLYHANTRPLSLAVPTSKKDLPWKCPWKFVIIQFPKYKTLCYNSTMSQHDHSSLLRPQPQVGYLARPKNFAASCCSRCDRSRGGGHRRGHSSTGKGKEYVCCFILSRPIAFGVSISNLKSESLVSFFRFLLPRSNKKRPKGLRL